VLSVAGFYDIMVHFRQGRWFIMGEKTVLFQLPALGGMTILHILDI